MNATGDYTAVVAALAHIIATLDAIREDQQRLRYDMDELFNELRKARVIEGMPE